MNNMQTILQISSLSFVINGLSVMIYFLSTNINIKCYVNIAAFWKLPKHCTLKMGSLFSHDADMENCLNIYVLHVGKGFLFLSLSACLSHTAPLPPSLHMHTHLSCLSCPLDPEAPGFKAREDQPKGYRLSYPVSGLS